MPSIAEIIAAKKAAATAPSATALAKSSASRETITERIETEEAINRIDPPGKRKTGGMVLSASTPLQPSEVAQKAAHSAARTSPQMEVPREVAQPSNDQQMCVVIEDRTVWLCMPCEDPATPPIKVLRLPLTVWPFPAAQPLPEGDPF